MEEEWQRVRHLVADLTRPRDCIFYQGQFKRTKTPLSPDTTETVSHFLQVKKLKAFILNGTILKQTNKNQ